MSHLKRFYRQLKDRRVIRTAVVYVALVWGALQVADLMAEAGLISDFLVRVLIFLALLGFPLALVISWFFETPWRERRNISILVDVAVIVAVGAAVFALAWQQFFVSFTRPTLALLKIEATDTREDTEAIGRYLTKRFSLPLVSRPEIELTALTSSLSPELAGRNIQEKAHALNADLLLTGTLNQGAEELRLNLQLYSADGRILWNERFENRTIDLAALEVQALNELWSNLPLPSEGIDSVKSALFDCDYPAEPDLVRSIILAHLGEIEGSQIEQQLSAGIQQNKNNGLLHLARAHYFFSQAESAPPPRLPVLNNLANQDLQEFAELCPDHPAATLARLHHGSQLLKDASEAEKYLARFPNDTFLRLEAASASLRAGDPARAAAFSWSAWLIDPLNPDTRCAAERILETAQSKRRLQGIGAHSSRFLSEPPDTCVEPRVGE